MVAGGRDGSILIVGTISVEQRSIRYCLRIGGYHIVCAADAEGAMTRLSEGPCCLLVWDLALGSHPLGRIRSAYPQLKILAIGGFDDAELLVTAAREGASTFVIRPFGEEQVINATTSLLIRGRLSIGSSPEGESQPTPDNWLVQEHMEGVVDALINALNVKDRYSGSHSLRVADRAAGIARELSLSPSAVSRVRWAGLLHDVGKLGVDSNVLNKPGRLTFEEYERIKRHPGLARHIVELIGTLGELFPIIHHHHENYDGTGYPRGIGGDDIPLEARIVAVADVYDALISDRPYRAAYPTAVARSILQKLAGSQLDREVVRAFMSLIQRQSSSASHLRRDVA